MSDTQKGAALITGAARRIGRSIAETLAASGHPVAIHFRGSSDDARAAVDAIEAEGGRAVALQADLGAEDETQGLVARAADALGSVEVLVNNASVFEHDSVRSASRDSWDRHMETNLRAPFVLMQAMTRQLPEGRKGNIINILDERVWNLTPHFVSYTVSKAGLWALTQTMALALAPTIRVNGIGPGPTLPSPRQTQEQFDRQAAIMPLGHGTSPEEVAAAVQFILSAPAMTGQMIALDGGQHLGWAQPPRDSGPMVE